MTISTSADGVLLSAGSDVSVLAGPAGPQVPRRKRGRPRDPQADTRILESAADLLLELGYDAMTVDDVAARAHVGKATVYRRFAKKEELAVAAMRRLYDTRIPVPDTGSLRGDLTEVVRAVLEFATSDAGAAYLRTAVAESSRDPRIAALYRSANADSEAGSRKIYLRAIERGEVRPDVNIDVAIQLMTGILLVRTVTGTPMPGLDEAESMVDLLVHGLS